MSLEDKISQDYIVAMKARDSFQTSVLSFLRAQVKNVKIDKRIETVPDEEVIAIVRKQIKQRQESITQFTAGGRIDLAEKEEKELGLLQSYLPVQASTEVVSAAVQEAIRSTGATSIKDMGKVMKEALTKLAGKADSAQVSVLVKEHLSKI